MAQLTVCAGEARIETQCTPFCKAFTAAESTLLMQPQMPTTINVSTNLESCKSLHGYQDCISHAGSYAYHHE